MVYRSQLLSCPDCHVPLQSVGPDGLALDRCGGCGGTWVDAKTLDELFRRIDATKQRPQIRPQVPPVGVRGRACPTCNQPMAICTFGGIHIDQCSHGLWFDGEELELALAAAAAKPERAPATWHVLDGIASGAEATGHYVLELAIATLTGL